MEPINLRSDTQTLPTPAMRRAMAEAELGDDTYGEDPTVTKLERMVAERLETEASMLLLSGTMANLVALMTHCRPSDEVYLDAHVHVLRNEAGGLSNVAGVVPHTVDSERGHILPEALRAAIPDPDIHRPDPRLVWLENTHNRGGGSVLPYEQQQQILEVARDKKLAVHLDGARIFNAATALDRPVPELVEGIDSVYVDLTKGLSCPLGALLAGPADLIEEARQNRRVVGGGMRQAGVIAACGIVAMEHLVDRVSEDHELARWLAQRLSEIEGFDVDPDTVETNMVFVRVDQLGGTSRVVEALRESRVIVSGRPPNELRLVTHLQITEDMAREAIQRMEKVASELLASC